MLVISPKVRVCPSGRMPDRNQTGVGRARRPHNVPPARASTSSDDRRPATHKADTNAPALWRRVAPRSRSSRSIRHRGRKTLFGPAQRADRIPGAPSSASTTNPNPARPATALSLRRQSPRSGHWREAGFAGPPRRVRRPNRLDAMRRQHPRISASLLIVVAITSLPVIDDVESLILIIPHGP